MQGRGTNKSRLMAVTALAWSIAAIGFPGVSNAQTAVTVNYGNTARTGTPNIFGVVPKTRLSERNATFPALERYGIRFARTTALLQEILPANITLAQYQASMATSPGLNDTGVADPSTWNWGETGPNQNKSFSWQVPYIRQQGINVYLTITNLPAWLSYPEAPTNPVARNVPTDWAVYQDIIAKVYSHYKDDVSWVCILNEPDDGNLLRVEGSPYAGQGGSAANDIIDAYHDMYLHASAAIRAINPTIPIGGADLQGSTTAYMRDLISSSSVGAASAFGEVPAANFNFYSSHPYGTYFPTDENAAVYQNVATSLGRTLSVYHTEWNYDEGVAQDTNVNFQGTRGMAFVGSFLSQLMYQNSSGASMYYFVNPDQTVANDVTGAGGFWMYDFDTSGNLVLNQNMKAFRLVSRVLGLGDGAYDVKSFSYSGDGGSSPTYGRGAGAQNFGGERVLFYSNFQPGSSPVSRDIVPNLNNVGFAGPGQIEVYLATGTDEGVAPVSVYNFTSAATGLITLPTVAVPPQAILGLKVKQIVSSDTFEADAIGARPPAGWTYDDARGGFAEVASFDSGATKGITLSDSSSAQKVQVARTVASTSGRVTVSFRARAGQTNQQAGFNVLDSSGNLLTTVAFDTNGTIYSYDRTTLLPGLATYSSNTWYDVRLVIDTNLDLYDAYIGGVQVVDRKRLRTSANVTNIAGLRLNTSSAGSGNFSYDDIYVTK